MKKNKQLKYKNDPLLKMLVVCLIGLVIIFGYSITVWKDSYNQAMSTVAELKCPMIQYETEINCSMQQIWRVSDVMNIKIIKEYSNFELSYLDKFHYIKSYIMATCIEEGKDFRYTWDCKKDIPLIIRENYIYNNNSFPVEIDFSVTTLAGEQKVCDKIYYNFTTGRYLPEENKIECYNIKEEYIYLVKDITKYQSNECKLLHRTNCGDLLECENREGGFQVKIEYSQKFTLEELGI